jgi:phosphoglycerate dehydrogenase-like enzyme
LPNVLVTPHNSSSTEATADRRWSVVAANLDRSARGAPGLGNRDRGCTKMLPKQASKLALADAQPCR